MFAWSRGRLLVLSPGAASLSAEWTREPSGMTHHPLPLHERCGSEHPCPAPPGSTRPKLRKELLPPGRARRRKSTTSPRPAITTTVDAEGSNGRRSWSRRQQCEPPPRTPRAVPSPRSPRCTIHDPRSPANQLSSFSQAPDKAATAHHGSAHVVSPALDPSSFCPNPAIADPSHPAARRAPSHASFHQLPRGTRCHQHSPKLARPHLQPCRGGPCPQRHHLGTSA